MTSINRKQPISKQRKPESADALGTILEADRPLSQSMIWQLQADFYANQGPEAWSKGVVPQYITTNPYIATLYAKTVFGYCRDIASCKEFDKETPIYIMELAAGVGRFTYTFLKKFLSLLEKSSLKGLKFHYIITDLAERNVSYWQNHSYLKPYFESGILDCATFDMTKDEELLLRNSRKLLKKDCLKNPLILFANYTFDSLPQDTFYVNKGMLYEGLITVTASDTGADAEDKSILAGLNYSYQDHPIEGNDYYEDKNMNDILLYYKDCLEDTAFSVPNKALHSLRRLNEIFGDDLVLISTDKGYRNTHSMHKNYHPFLSKHGSISLMVNFHAMELYFQRLGGQAIHSIYEHENVTMSLFLLSARSHSFMETGMAFHEIIESIGPDDFYTIKKAVVSHHKSFTTRELLTFLRYTVWDERTFIEFYNTLLERISNEKDFPKEELIRTIHHIEEYYFPIGEEGDLFYCLGSLLGYFEQDTDAIRLFLSSLKFYGEDAGIYYEIALSYYNMQEAGQAMTYLEESLRLEPSFPESLALKLLLESPQ